MEELSQRVQGAQRGSQERNDAIALRDKYEDSAAYDAWPEEERQRMLRELSSRLLQGWQEISTLCITGLNKANDLLVQMHAEMAAKAEVSINFAPNLITHIVQLGDLASHFQEEQRAQAELDKALQAAAKAAAAAGAEVGYEVRAEVGAERGAIGRVEAVAPPASMAPSITVPMIPSAGQSQASLTGLLTPDQGYLIQGVSIYSNIGLHANSISIALY